MSVNVSQASSSQMLPPREASLFKKILKHFKDKQFKNGLKICNQILSNPKFAEHGETLSMKGLILNSMGKKQEALDYVRRGLKNDVKSHVCWHVFGLLQKADHKYEEAIKCYRNALRLKKDSVQILSDLSLVQIQTRDLEGYRDSRYQLFSLRPGERSTWIGCAMAYHLTGDHMTAINILSEYQKSSSAGNNFRNRYNRRQNNEIYEHSEFLLYHVFILLECNRYEEALALLDQHENDIVDKMSYFEYKCQIYLALNRFDDAQFVLFEQLINRNPENVEYFQLLEKATQVQGETQRLQLYEKLAQKYPRSMTIARFPLTFLTVLDVFREKMDSYLKIGFRKGRPALFRDMKHLYNTEMKSSLTSFTCSKLDQTMSNSLSRPEIEAIIKAHRKIHLTPKIEVIESLLLDYMDNLILRNTFDSDSDQEESATCLLWVYYFLAQHFDALKEFSLALHFANRALNHTPTLIDIFVIKAKIFKHAGYLEKAVKCLDEAQSLDTSDRYLNSKCAKYLIRVNKVKEAENMCLKFTREGVSAAENLNEMQCMWFQNEVAKAYQRMGMLGSALIKCIEVDNHFAEINEDQFDFNTYCILKVTLRAYVKMIRLEDRIKSHRFFINAAKTAIEIYLRLYDNPIDDKSEANNDNNSNLSASEQRKLRNKERKKLLKATAEKENEKSQKKPNAKRDNDSKAESAEVFDPIKLEKTEDPLNDAGRFLNPVKLFGKESVEIHMLAFEVYYRKGKLLLQLQCLKRAHRICSAESRFYPSLLRQSLLFLNGLIARKEQINEAIRNVLKQELSTIQVFDTGKAEHGDIDIFARLPTVDYFIAKHLPPDSESFLVRSENVRVKNLLAKFNSEFPANNSTANQQQNSIQNGKPAATVPVATDDIKETMARLIDDLKTLKHHLSLENCSEFFEAAKTGQFGLLPDDMVEQLRQRCHSLYPFASCFMNESELEALEQELSVNDFFTIEPEEYNLNVPEEN